MIVVANAGPLIALAKIGQLHLIRSLYGPIIRIPPAAAKRRGIIESVAPLLDELACQGFHMDEEVRLATLALAGEGS